MHAHTTDTEGRGAIRLRAPGLAVAFLLFAAATRLRFTAATRLSRQALGLARSETAT